ncbi:hypothetical protein NQ314_019820 [Rhamnusium bicolor]|uniref:type I protein arginine methyltransferase n=1 Tax=Rhamnusium bicolor TaxID=1586634 RepID=A0AAV8WMG4_9CUCU|nr:hypothetical protein NQ314_019820 [Rhamnusium bicolor]
MADDKDICSGGPTNEDEDSDGWDEMEVSGEQTTCLFCDLQFHTIAVALDHCRSEHNFDLLSLKNKYNMDCYSYIKMINYIRLQKPDPKILTESLEYFDDLGSAPSTPHYAIDGKTPISNINFSDLQRQIQELTMQVRHRDMLLENYLKDMEKMKEVTRTIVESGDIVVKKIPYNINSSGCDSSDYFNSYSHFGIHHDMLNDKVRTESYRDAIVQNSKFFNGKTVLDVGCGTGMLDSFIYARDAYLKPDGLILPNRCNISIVGICDVERYDKVINFWDDVYGFSMKCMKKEALKEAFIEVVPEEKLLTSSAILTEIDLRTCNISACIFSSKFTITANKDGVLTAIAGYFDTFFDLEYKEKQSI